MNLSSNTSRARQLLLAWHKHDTLESILPISFLLYFTFIPSCQRWHESNLVEYRMVKNEIKSLQ